jgi:putative PIN family toxin of toxin-antitoxin system
MRIVFDTNVLLAGILTRGVCEALLDLTLGNAEHTVLCSHYILDEFLDAALRKFHAPPAEARRAVEIIRRQVEIVVPIQVAEGTCRDADDLPVLGTALAAKADCLVTGDRDLLDIQSFQEIPIVSPRAMLSRLV